jgi:hypothetical protein
MANTAVFSVAAGPTYADALTFETSGKYLEKASPGTPDYQYDELGAPGEDGAGSKKYGFRGQKITLEVIYVGTSADNIAGSADDDAYALGDGIGDLALRGVTYHDCKLEEFVLTQDPASTGLPSGLFWARYRIVVKALQLE